MLLLTLMLRPGGASAQEETPGDTGVVRRITLDETIMLARARSVDAAVALNELRTAYWQYRTFRADLLPEVSFTATLPAYRKSYSSYQLDNGA